MKDTIVQMGLVVLGVLIVAGLVLGMMKDNSEDIGKATNDRYKEIYDSIN